MNRIVFSRNCAVGGDIFEKGWPSFVFRLVIRLQNFVPRGTKFCDAKLTSVSLTVFNLSEFVKFVSTVEPLHRAV